MRRASEDPAGAEFRDFVIGSQIRLTKFAEFLTRDRGYAEDLVQHAYAKVFSSWSKLRTGNPEAYARRVIANGHTDRWRRGSWRERPIEDAVDQADDLGDFSFDSAERDALVRALGELTRRERVAVTLRYYCDLSTGEIARETGVAEATVRTTVFRALAKLRESQHLARDGGKA